MNCNVPQLQWPRRYNGPGPGWAQSGLGPGPGWGPYGPIWVLLDRSWQVRTCPISDFWSNFARFGSKNCILIKFYLKSNISSIYFPQLRISS